MLKAEMGRAEQNIQHATSNIQRQTLNLEPRTLNLEKPDKPPSRGECRRLNDE
jgi:hypothetical protein